jgi:hypothetical protein
MRCHLKAQRTNRGMVLLAAGPEIVIVCPGPSTAPHRMLRPLVKGLPEKLRASSGQRIALVCRTDLQLLCSHEPLREAEADISRLGFI